MPFTYDSDQRDFIGTVTAFLSDRSHQPKAELWDELLAMDLPALLVPEELGGLGLSTVDMVAVIEAAGRFSLEVPLAMTIGPFTHAAVAACASDDAAREIVASVLRGTTGTIATTTAGGSASSRAARLTRGRLSVDAVVVPDADADLVAVPAVRTETHELVLVVASPERLGVNIAAGMDGTTLGILELDGHDLDGAVVFGQDEAVLPIAWIAAAAELVGLAAELVDRAASYAKDRIQFGHPIGHFQGVKHRLVDVHLEVERARSLTLYAALEVAENGPATVRAAHYAKAAASEAATAAGRAAVQVHGGSGITAEEPVSQLYLRARQKSLLLGSPEEHYALATDC